MILADTSIFVGFWRTPCETVTQAFLSNEVFICGVVRAELYHGARSEADIRRIDNALASFHELPVAEAIWGLLGKICAN